MECSVTRVGIFDMQVCVPKEWSDEDVLHFAELHNPAGTSGGWYIRKQGNKRLNGYDERVQCDEYKENCHIMLEV